MRAIAMLNFMGMMRCSQQTSATLQSAGRPYALLNSQSTSQQAHS